ncbi:hypothetical protein B5V03_28630 [Bradyrhizobium betae]|uniref:Uncharacterized protein n=1 Tax=Bradyrhizobium betae TaxID=244734 RepID=A0A4Q1USE0_9BRAD|nr:hypothetical protein B5V03_28630 [Bradyrhizobium betae]
MEFERPLEEALSGLEHRVDGRMQPTAVPANAKRGKILLATAMFDKRYSLGICSAWCDVLQFARGRVTHNAVWDEPVAADHQPAANNLMVRVLSGKFGAIVMTIVFPSTVGGFEQTTACNAGAGDNVIEVSRRPVDFSQANPRSSKRTANSRAASSSA